VSGYVPVAVAFNVRRGHPHAGVVDHGDGNMAIDTLATLLEGLRLQKGLPAVITNLAADRDVILVKYLNEYENATIDVRPEPNRDRTSVDVTALIHEAAGARRSRARSRARSDDPVDCRKRCACAAEIR
jgi:hypothetical protein